MHLSNSAGIEMDNLVKRMHTSIGATSANHIYRVISYNRKRIFHALPSAFRAIDTDGKHHPLPGAVTAVCLQKVPRRDGVGIT